MTQKLEIRLSGPVRGQIRPPGSKSITNRALVCAALARGREAGAEVCEVDFATALETLLGDGAMQDRLAATSADMKRADGRQKAARLLDELIKSQAMG